MCDTFCGIRVSESKGRQALGWSIDPVAGSVVQDIFKMKLQG